jgi:hypothetical protein
LQSCIRACRKNDECKSIAYVTTYSECLFYNVTVEGTHLVEDASSNFIKFDPEYGFYDNLDINGNEGYGETKRCGGNKTCDKEEQDKIDSFFKHLFDSFKQRRESNNRKGENCGEEDRCGEKEACGKYKECW